MARGDFASAKQVQYALRFTDGMRNELKRRASGNRRSMNSEIVIALEKHLAEAQTANRSREAQDV